METGVQCKGQEGLNMVMDEKEHRKPRYIIGVDLGTTNISVSYVDTETSPVQIKDFFVKQIIAPGEIDTQQLYPSFYYDAAESEFAEASLAMPWDKSEKNLLRVFSHVSMEQKFRAGWCHLQNHG